MYRYLNHYECTCGTTWTDEWPCMSDDRCPTCQTSIQPHQSDDQWSLSDLIRSDDEDDREEARSRSADLLDSIHALVDGKEWDSQSTADLCDLLSAEGYTIRSPDEVEDGQ